MEDFDRWLAEEIARTCKSDAEKKATRQARNQRYEDKRTDQEAAKNRSRKRENYYLHTMKKKMNENNMDVRALMAENEAKDAAEDAEYEKKINQLDEEDSRLIHLIATAQQSTATRRKDAESERSYRRLVQSERRHMVYKLVEIQGKTKPAPEPVFQDGIDTPMRPKRKAATAEDFMSTPAREQKKQKAPSASLKPRSLDFGSIKEDIELELAPPTEHRIITIKFVDGNKEIQVHDVTAKNFQGFAQVLDCSVTLQGGVIVPVSYMEKINPSFWAQTTGTLVANPPKATEKLATEIDGTPLQVEEAIMEIFAHKDVLVAKSLDKCFVWKYKANEGIFQGPAVFKTQIGAKLGLPHAATDHGVVGFDIDLKSKRHAAILRKATLAMDDKGAISAGDEVKVQASYLPKNRIDATVASGAGRLFLLATKKEGQHNLLAHIFVEDGTLKKLGGFAEGSVVEIAGNDTHMFARLEDGSVFYFDGIDIEKPKWTEFLTKDEASLGLASLCSFDEGCFGLNGKCAVILTPKGDGGCGIVNHHLDLGEITHVDGSGTRMAFLGSVPVPKEEIGDDDKDGVEEDDRKPAAAN